MAAARDAEQGIPSVEAAVQDVHVAKRAIGSEVSGALNPGHHRSERITAAPVPKEGEKQLNRL